MIIELRGRHNETLIRIDTSAYKHCEGIFIHVTPVDANRQHSPAIPEWKLKRKIPDLSEPLVQTA